MCVRKGKLPGVMKKYAAREEIICIKLSRRIADQYDIVAVEDIDMKAMSQCLHFGEKCTG